MSTGSIEIMDSEILRIETVLDTLRIRSQRRRNYDDFDREIKDRFAKIGFLVDVKWWTAAGADGVELSGTIMPDVEIIGRVDSAFNPDQQVHEVTHDILGLGDGGVIKTTPEMLGEHTKHKH